MMARAHPSFALRPYLPQDAAVLAEIFRASIEELTEDDYNPAQQDAWAAAADDLELGVALRSHGRQRRAERNAEERAVPASVGSDPREPSVEARKRVEPLPQRRGDLGMRADHRFDVHLLAGVDPLAAATDDLRRELVGAQEPVSFAPRSRSASAASARP